MKKNQQGYSGWPGFCPGWVFCLYRQIRDVIFSLNQELQAALKCQETLCALCVYFSSLGVLHGNSLPEAQAGVETQSFLLPKIWRLKAYRRPWYVGDLENAKKKVKRKGRKGAK